MMNATMYNGSNPGLVRMALLFVTLPLAVRAADDPGEQQSMLLASLERTGCYGWCPAYTVEIAVICAL